MIEVRRSLPEVESDGSRGIVVASPPDTTKSRITSPRSIRLRRESTYGICRQLDHPLVVGCVGPDGCTISHVGLGTARARKNTASLHGENGLHITQPVADSGYSEKPHGSSELCK